MVFLRTFTPLCSVLLTFTPFCSLLRRFVVLRRVFGLRRCPRSRNRAQKVSQESESGSKRCPGAGIRAQGGVQERVFGPKGGPGRVLGVRIGPKGGPGRSESGPEGVQKRVIGPGMCPEAGNRARVDYPALCTVPTLGYPAYVHPPPCTRLPCTAWCTHCSTGRCHGRATPLPVNPLQSLVFLEE